MSDPVRNIYKGRFVAKEKLDAAEARIAELEKYRDILESEVIQRTDRIAELEKVAEAAEYWLRHCTDLDRMVSALRAAGYLGVRDE